MKNKFEKWLILPASTCTFILMHSSLKTEYQLEFQHLFQTGEGIKDQSQCHSTVYMDFYVPPDGPVDDMLVAVKNLWGRPHPFNHLGIVLITLQMKLWHNLNSSQWCINSWLSNPMSFQFTQPCTLDLMVPRCVCFSHQDLKIMIVIALLLHQIWGWHMTIGIASNACLSVWVLWT